MTEETVNTPLGEISYTLTYKRVRNCNLRVRADGSVAVSVPMRTAKRTAEAFVVSHAAFIFRAKERMRKAREQSADTDGGGIWYRGKRYTLRTEKGRTRVAFAGDTLVFFLPDPDASDLADRLTRALAALYAPLLKERCAYWGEVYAKWGVKPPREIRFRKMTSMWGNCRPEKGILTFSTMLTEVPDECLDYVICHEYAHFLHPDHSPAFYRALARVYPDWERVRRELKRKKYRTVNGEGKI